ncbi:hypothetical protein GMRT_12642 [Giardia muris]|uniref:Uncharacterized protein n=1 Tax=Giardia muris TaxID=5742 RepID=A0A4Z1T1M9_GIAMU|nr:hypothetical protein GMRT_12642 [Giardia muris]|eukprot:TNJ27833.1 hypothetical protein GMRT_12642 [Giardia muris]
MRTNCSPGALEGAIRGGVRGARSPGGLGQVQGPRDLSGLAGSRACIGKLEPPRLVPRVLIDTPSASASSSDSAGRPGQLRQCRQVLPPIASGAETGRVTPTVQHSRILRRHTPVATGAKGTPGQARSARAAGACISSQYLLSLLDDEELDREQAPVMLPRVPLVLQSAGARVGPVRPFIEGSPPRRGRLIRLPQKGPVRRGSDGSSTSSTRMDDLFFSACARGPRATKDTRAANTPTSFELIERQVRPDEDQHETHEAITDLCFPCDSEGSEESMESRSSEAEEEGGDEVVARCAESLTLTSKMIAEIAGERLDSSDEEPEPDSERMRAPSWAENASTLWQSGDVSRSLRADASVLHITQLTDSFDPDILQTNSVLHTTLGGTAGGDGRPPHLDSLHRLDTRPFVIDEPGCIREEGEAEAVRRRPSSLTLVARSRSRD